MQRMGRSFFFHFFTILFGLFMIYPILWTFASSLKSNSEIFQHSTSLIPMVVKWSNYANGWKGFGSYSFTIFFRNSIIITVLVVIGTLFSSSLVAFGFARLQFWLRGFLFACLIGTMMLPMQITLIPQYILFKQLGWVNTFFPLIVPAFLGGVPFFIFLMVQFIRGIPRDLDESAYMDGCSTYGIFFKIILPLARPALFTTAIFSFYWTWNDFLAPLVYLNNPNLQTVSLALRFFSDPTDVSQWGYMFAMATLSLIPQLLIFFIFQKYIVEGIATTGVKG